MIDCVLSIITLRFLPIVSFHMPFCCLLVLQSSVIWLRWSAYVLRSVPVSPENLFYIRIFSNENASICSCHVECKKIHIF